MMEVAAPLERGEALLELDCDLLCVHRAHDMQGEAESPWRTLARLREAVPAAGLAIAGGIELEALESILPLDPQVIVVGSAITGAEDPAEMARQFQERIRAYDNR